MEPSTLYCLPIDIVLTADEIAILLNDAKNSKVWWEGGQWGPNPITSSRNRKWISTASEANSAMEQIDVVTGPMCCWLVAPGGKLKLTMMWSWSWISQEITCEKFLWKYCLLQYPWEGAWVAWVGREQKSYLLKARMAEATQWRRFSCSHKYQCQINALNSQLMSYSMNWWK